MTDSRFPYLIAVDGGGTSCRFALLKSGATPPQQLVVTGGSANVYTAPDQAVETLSAGLADLQRQSGLTDEVFHQIPVYAGLAGVIDGESAARVAEALPQAHVRVEDDRMPAVVGALGDDTASLIGVGTGSFLGRQVAGQVTLIGGHGTVLGDEASGGWLGRRALQLTLQAAEGIEPMTPLLRSCLRDFSNETAKIVRFAQTARPVAFGVYAPRVAKAAVEGDAAGRRLMAEGAEYLCNGLQALGRRPEEPVYHIGGVAAQYAAYLPADVADYLRGAEGSPLDGALELARRFAREIAQEVV
ncbi:BadF/BadG/BcrA/BcrD ATPase family protein [Phaeobacter inhibens]|uniref:BadF/BadG/BcrA/BcrD ATPase family protein n=1 Tax=Phaeobacter inhibens TaxID=221822 RepID=UPI0021A3ED59|nr:BadF/BadG/BcrA/BcrD ATPase family protein [Phaeobacter inhibens]UWR95404.1 ATPase [Phaeobacter inhibens]